jgi:hypothetical protein
MPFTNPFVKSCCDPIEFGLRHTPQAAALWNVLADQLVDVLDLTFLVRLARVADIHSIRQK